MKKVILKSLSVISPTLKKAKTVEFDEILTIIKSEYDDGNSVNNTGKSLIMKSIFYALGAKLTSYPKNWKTINIVTVIKFSYSSEDFTLFRCGESFVLTNNSTSKTDVFSNVEKLRDFYKGFFNIELQLLMAKSSTGDKDPQLHIPYPSALFLPFYIDQDAGWDGRWRSFQELQMYKDYRKEIFSFHTGMRKNKYYKLLLDKNVYQKSLVKNQKDKSDCDITIAGNMSRFKDIMGKNIDINLFKEEIYTLIAMLDNVHNEKERVKSKLLSEYNQSTEIKDSLENIYSILIDLEKDQRYMDKSFENEVIVCPICGTEHKNTITTRYLFLLDIEECNDKVREFKSQLARCTKNIENLEKEISMLAQKEIHITKILQKKKDKIELKDVLVSHGINALISRLTKDAGKLQNDIEKDKVKLSEIDKKLRVYKQIEEEIAASFNQYINTNVAALGISDVEFDEVKKVGSIVAGGGSDLSKIVLAYTMAYYKLIAHNEDAVVFPLVIDTMLQQEQSTESISDIFKVVLDNQPDGSQMILATTNTHGARITGKVYSFLDKRAVLSEDDYLLIEKEYIHYLALLAT